MKPNIILQYGLARQFDFTTPRRRAAIMTMLMLPPIRARVVGLCERFPEEDHGEVLVGCVDFVEARIIELAAAWAAHPDYKSAGSTDVHNPYCVGLYRHEPGREGRTVFCLVAPLASVIGKYAWCLSRMGEFIGIGPVPEEWIIDPYRIGFVNNSPRTQASRGFFCRTRLREVLPGQVRKYITQARRVNRAPKTRFLPGGYTPVRDANGKVDRSVYRDAQSMVQPVPAWYRKQTKAEIWLSRIPSSDARVIAAYLPLDAFWRAATGRMMPDKLEEILCSDMTPRAARDLARGQQDLFLPLPVLA